MSAEDSIHIEEADYIADTAKTPATPVTCIRPDCNRSTTRADATYYDSHGYVCHACDERLTGVSHVLAPPF